METDGAGSRTELARLLASLALPPEARPEPQPPGRLEEAIWGGRTDLVHLFLASGADVEEAIRRMLAESAWGPRNYEWLADFAGVDLVGRVRAGESIEADAERLRERSLEVAREIPGFGRVLAPVARDEVPERAPAVDRARELIAAGVVDDDFVVRHRERLHFGASMVEEWTPLVWAAAKGLEEIVEALLDAGADPNREDPEHCQTPLAAASDAGFLGIVQRLLAAGADPDRASDPNELPLHRAARHGHPAIVESLLAHGADPRAHDAAGLTAVEAAHGPYRPQILASLREAIRRRPASRGEGLRSIRQKTMFDPAEARGARAFVKLCARDEVAWVVLAAEAEVEETAAGCSALLPGHRRVEDVARREVPDGDEVVAVFRLAGSSWSLVIHRLGWVPAADREAARVLARRLSETLGARVVAFDGEPRDDSASCAAFRSGRPDPAGDGVRTPRGGDRLLARLGIFLPPCWLHRDGIFAVLEVRGVRKSDVERVDVLVLDEAGDPRRG